MSDLRNAASHAVTDLLTAADLLHERWKAQSKAVSRRLLTHSQTVNTLWSRVDQSEQVLRKILHWASSRCPCENEEPNPCPLCGASVENLEACKAVENIFPRDLLREIRDLIPRP